MKALTVEAPAKINLCLKIGNKLPNGYHEIFTVMQTVGLCDELTLKLESTPPVYFMNNAPAKEDNLIVRAANAFYRTIGRAPQASIFLTKKIPFSAGLGGGSTDAAAVLRGLNLLHEQPLGLSQLLELAKSLGADVPFCLTGGCCLATGIGEKLTPLPASEPYAVWLQKKHQKQSTAAMYALADSSPHIDLSDWKLIVKLLKTGRRTTAFTLCENDFLTVSANRIEQWQMMNRLYGAGAVLAGLSGSGPTVFGLFRSAKELPPCGAENAGEIWCTQTLNDLPQPVWLQA